MLAKALKHDMKAIWRFWWIIAVSVCGLSVVSSVVLRFVISNIDREAGLIFNIIIAVAMLFSVISIAAIVVSPAATSIIVYLRFYKNFFTDEGYLTFTLPVSRAKLFLSKTINALIWNALHIAVLIGCFFIFILIGIPTDHGAIVNYNFFGELFELFRVIFDGAPFEAYLWVALYVIEYIILIAVSAFLFVNLVHLCITIGAIVAKKGKVIVAIGIYYLVNVVFSTVVAIIGNLFIISLAGGFVQLLENASTYIILSIIAVIVFMIIVAVAGIGMMLYLVTLDKLERRLNLA